MGDGPRIYPTARAFYARIAELESENTALRAALNLLADEIRVALVDSDIDAEAIISAAEQAALDGEGEGKPKSAG